MLPKIIECETSVVLPSFSLHPFTLNPNRSCDRPNSGCLLRGSSRAVLPVRVHAALVADDPTQQMSWLHPIVTYGQFNFLVDTWPRLIWTSKAAEHTWHKTINHTNIQLACFALTTTHIFVFKDLLFGVLPLVWSLHEIFRVDIQVPAMHWEWIQTLHRGQIKCINARKHSIPETKFTFATTWKSVHKRVKFAISPGLMLYFIVWNGLSPCKKEIKSLKWEKTLCMAPLKTSWKRRARESVGGAFRKECLMSYNQWKSLDVEY